MTNKICFISLHAYPLFNPNCTSNFGGSEVQLYQLARQLAQNLPYHISFLVSDFGQPTHETRHNVNLIKVFPLQQTGPKIILGPYYQTLFLLKLIQANADVYIQRAAGIETGITALFCQLFHKKFIYMTASSIDVDGTYRRHQPFEGFFYELGLRLATKVITQNLEHQKLLKNKYNISSSIIRNSFTLPQKLPSLRDRHFILWLGSSQPLKQPHLFINLAKKLPCQKFVVIMPKHDPRLWEDISQQSKKISNLNLIEKVPFRKINSFFSRAKLFINTSIFEGFPNTFVQAAMNGTPIISLNVNPEKFLDK